MPAPDPVLTGAAPSRGTEDEEKVMRGSRKVHPQVRDHRLALLVWAGTALPVLAHLAHVLG